MKQEEFMYRSQLPRMLKIIDYFEKSAELMKEFDTPVYKVCVKN